MCRQRESKTGRANAARSKKFLTELIHAAVYLKHVNRTGVSSELIVHRRADKEPIALDSNGRPVLVAVGKPCGHDQFLRVQ